MQLLPPPVVVEAKREKDVSLVEGKDVYRGEGRRLICVGTHAHLYY